MGELADFIKLKRAADEGEATLKDAKAQLKSTYAGLVMICPHSEAVDRKSNIRGMGTTRRCKICGITDYASEGGTSGDEYDYGYPGWPSRTFWKNSEVEVVSDKQFEKYDRHHDWVVTAGKARKRFE